MAGVGVLLAALGIIGIIYGFIMRAKVGRVAGAPFVKTGQATNPGAAAPNGAVSVEGNVECPQPLLSPCTHTPCLYYELKVVGYWKQGETAKSKNYVDEKRGTAFSLNDGSGAISVLAGEGGDFEPMERTFNETKKEGFLADLKSAVGKGEAIMFGQYAFQNPTNSVANRFECVERVLKVQSRLYANGRLDGGTIQKPGWRGLILDARGRDEVLGRAMKASKIALGVGAGALVVGTALGLIGNASSSGPSASEPSETPSLTSAVRGAAIPAAPAEPEKATAEAEPARAPAAAPAPPAPEIPTVVKASIKPPSAASAATVAVSKAEPAKAGSPATPGATAPAAAKPPATGAAAPKAAPSAGAKK
jgi:hypothetical protein